MKRVNYLLTLLCLLCSATPMAAYDFEYGGIYYNVTSETTVEVTYNENEEVFYTGNIVIPPTAPNGSNTYAVTSIGEVAFALCESLTSVTIPESVTSIGLSAFVHCESLTSVTIPNTVKSIGDDAFNFCTGLKSVTIPNSVTSIGSATFANCKSLTSITIPSSVTSIGLYTFYGCESLTSITIPSSVTSIGDEAFCYCKSLITVAILGGATSIEDYAFGDCDVLETIYVPYESVETYQANENLAEHSEKIKGSIDVELKASIGGAYASVYLPFPATLAEGDAKAYVGASLEAGTLTLARATEIAANEGFILYADAATTATLRVGATEEAVTSIIEGTNTDIALTDDNRADYLVFGISNEEIGFFKPAASIGSIPANRAFLPNTGGVSAVRMQFDFGTTGIEVIENGEWRMETAPVYDLSGRRVTSPAKGSLYIRNGQKFIWK